MNALLITSLLTTCVGILNLLGIHQSYFRSQLIFALLGLGVYFLVKKIGIHFFRINAHVLYWFFIISLLVTYIIGDEIKGSRRWIDLYFFSFQASEFFKIIFMIFLADFFTRYRKEIRSFSFFLKSFAYFLLPAFIIFKQPDLGSALVYVSIFFSVAFFSGIPRINIAKVVVLGMSVIPLGWFFLKDYQRARILTFLNPNINQSGDAYNMIQAIITVGSGKFLGRGLGAGTQSGLSFLPEDHTDFAFSSLVEQFGFVGGLTLLILYAVVAFILIKKILTFYYRKNDDDKFKFLFLVGFFTFFITQVFINAGMNMGIMPITGITLPLISYGGSSLLTWMIGIALLP